MMESTLGLSQNQQLRQRLTPRQVRLGRMLEMSAPEFEDEVHRVLDENPALVVAEHDAPAQDSEEFHESAEELQRADYASPDDIPYYRLNISNHSADDDYSPREQADDTASGIDSLTAQLADYDISPRLREIAYYIIGNLDSNGYLTRRPEAIADDIAMGAGFMVEPDEMARAMEVVRSLDPAGICATDLRDCLLLQLNRLADTSGAVDNAKRIIEGCFEAFSKRHFDRIRASLNISRDEFDAAMRVISSLNPKPGAFLETSADADHMMRITPDFNVETAPDGTVTLTLAGRVPDLEIEESFRPDAVKNIARGSVDAQAFIKSRREEASDFIELAKMRSQTLMSVGKAIVALQPEFFADFDRSRLRPMVLRDVAALTHLDLSVISRATSSKYMMTPRGMILLKSLFSEGVGEESEASSHAIDEAIKSLIENEDKRQPLSDAAITDALAAKGLEVARRTVTKYRERMKIPVARMRRNS